MSPTRPANKVKAVKNAGLPLDKNGNGLMVGPNSVLYLIGQDALYEVRSDGDLTQFGETFAEQVLWGGAATMREISIYRPTSKCMTRNREVR